LSITLKIENDCIFLEDCLLSPKIEELK